MPDSVSQVCEVMVSGTIQKPRLRELRLGLEQPTAPLADMWASEA